MREWQQFPRELISTHAPREGSDYGCTGQPNEGVNFYPRSPRGERPRWRSSRFGSSDFYPRSPRGERPARPWRSASPLVFLPTLPARGATQAGVKGVDGIVISTHAPREGSDPLYVFHGRLRPLISTHAPREGSDLGRGLGSGILPPFLPTLPARGATLAEAEYLRQTNISTHAPREGSDSRPVSRVWTG